MSRRRDSRPRTRTTSSGGSVTSTRQGISIVMVEQNARTCLEICDRGYVLDQGRNAYTGTGEELLDDPKVIELYLGTLARAR
jgi:branched-chain amino acid transport system ATP-binding protein